MPAGIASRVMEALKLLHHNKVATHGRRNKKKILSNNSYAEKFFSLKVVTEALDWLLINVFLEEEKPHIPHETLINLHVWPSTNDSSLCSKSQDAAKNGRR